jgi:hypothetical protein
MNSFHLRVCQGSFGCEGVLPHERPAASYLSMGKAPSMIPRKVPYPATRSAPVVSRKSIFTFHISYFTIHASVTACTILQTCHIYIRSSTVKLNGSPACLETSCSGNLYGVQPYRSINITPLLGLRWLPLQLPSTDSGYGKLHIPHKLARHCCILSCLQVCAVRPVN